MARTEPRTEWNVLAATAVGASHQATGRPGQDAVRYAPGDHSSHEPLAVAVADGHGHRLHFRSQTGSRLAVEVACRVLLDASEAVAASWDEESVKETATASILPDLVAAWRAECLADTAARPVTHEELEAAGFSEEERSAISPADDDPLLAYGSTLMAAAISGRWMLLVQIGDGDIFTVDDDGSAASPVPGDPLLDGLRTTSLCQPDALGSFRVAVIDLATIAPGRRRAGHRRLRQRPEQ